MQYANLVREDTRIQKEEAAIVGRQGEIARKRADLFSQASVIDEEMFRKHAQIQEERIRLAKEEAEAELRLKKAAGGDRAFPAFVTHLESNERADLVETVEECRHPLDVDRAWTGEKRKAMASTEQR